MKELNPTGCQKRIYGDGDFRGHQCLNKPTVNRGDKLYCKIHDPEYIKAKRAKQEQQWDKEWLEKETRYFLENARKEATQGLTLDELRQVTPSLIRKALTLKIKGEIK